jgi:hypothetical protein
MGASFSNVVHLAPHFRQRRRRRTMRPILTVLRISERWPQWLHSKAPRFPPISSIGMLGGRNLWREAPGWGVDWGASLWRSRTKRFICPCSVDFFGRSEFRAALHASSAAPGHDASMPRFDDFSCVSARRALHTAAAARRRNADSCFDRAVWRACACGLGRAGVHFGGATVAGRAGYSGASSHP